MPTHHLLPPTTHQPIHLPPVPPFCNQWKKLWRERVRSSGAQLHTKQHLVALNIYSNTQSTKYEKHIKDTMWMHWMWFWKPFNHDHLTCWQVMLLYWASIYASQTLGVRERKIRTGPTDQSDGKHTPWEEPISGKGGILGQFHVDFLGGAPRSVPPREGVPCEIPDKFSQVECSGPTQPW